MQRVRKLKICFSIGLIVISISIPVYRGVIVVDEWHISGCVYTDE